MNVGELSCYVYAVTDISISHRALTYAGRVWLLHILSRIVITTQAGTGNLQSFEDYQRGLTKKP